MIEISRQWRKFVSEEEKIEKLKEWKLISKKATKIKTLLYKGIYINENSCECDIIGFVDDNEIIIQIQNKIHSIHPAYLKSMQKKNFKINEMEEENLP